MRGTDLFKKIIIDGNEVDISSIDYNNGKYVFNSSGNHEVEYVLKSTTNEIPANTFNNCESLTYINIPTQIESIGNNAFSGTSINDQKTINQISYLNPYGLLLKFIVYIGKTEPTEENILSLNESNIFKFSKEDLNSVNCGPKENIEFTISNESSDKEVYWVMYPKYFEMTAEISNPYDYPGDDWAIFYPVIKVKGEQVTHQNKVYLSRRYITGLEETTTPIPSININNTEYVIRQIYVPSNTYEMKFNNDMGISIEFADSEKVYYISDKPITSSKIKDVINFEGISDPINWILNSDRVVNKTDSPKDYYLALPLEKEVITNKLINGYLTNKLEYPNGHELFFDPVEFSYYPNEQESIKTIDVTNSSYTTYYPFRTYKFVCPANTAVFINVAPNK